MEHITDIEQVRNHAEVAISHERLREMYGAKAANLMFFPFGLDELHGTEYEQAAKSVVIPSFVGVSTEVFDAWLLDEPEYPQMLAAMNETAQQLADQSNSGMVLVRSSAVYSEDGEDHTAAGVYKTVLVDPRDSKQFSDAVKAVYDSVYNPSAISYRQSIGVVDEKMGLIIQTYICPETAGDEMPHGHINSRGTNPNIIEGHSQDGVLLFDRYKSLNVLLQKATAGSTIELLHTTPDHRFRLHSRAKELEPAVRATLLAEEIFGREMQIEYAGDQIVQVRPLPVHSFEDNAETITFPEHASEITSSRAIGVGDVTLHALSRISDNEFQTGYVIFSTEEEFTENWDRNTRALPESGAVIILNHSERGHLQTLCLERGLLCLYPDGKDDNRLANIGDFIAPSRPFGKSPDQRIRVVTDGYEGRIYQA
jgi:hypothetical protein